jgi:hypothetical protein
MQGQQNYSSFYSFALDGTRRQTEVPDIFTPGKKTPLSVYEEAGWAPEIFWKALERNISIPAGIELQTVQLMGI